jgi:electron transfer flavoprotein beta subunit
MEETLAEDASRIRVGRQVEGGLEVFDVPLPCVVTAQKGMNEPRYPTLKGIMGAKKKEVKEWKAADLQPAGLGPVAPALEIVALEALPPRPPGRILTGDPKDMARELVRTLREDVKAI